MLGARNERLNGLRGEIGVNLIPCGKTVCDQLAVDEMLGGQCFVPVFGCEREGVAVDVRGKDDAIVTDAHFDDVCDAVVGTGCDLFFTDLAGCIRDVDGVLADALTETLETCRGPT